MLSALCHKADAGAAWFSHARELADQDFSPWMCLKNGQFLERCILSLISEVGTHQGKNSLRKSTAC